MKELWYNYKELIIMLLVSVIILSVGTYLLMGNAGIARFKKNWESKWEDGIQREILIYNAGGELVFKLEGKFDFTYDSECIEYIDTSTGMKHNIFAGNNSTVIINEIGAD